MSDSKHLVTLQDTKLIAKAAVGPEIEILDFLLTNYSSEKLGFLGSHRHLKISIKNEHEESQEISCFVKALPLDSPLQLLYVQESRTFEKEAIFFSKISPLMTDGSSTGPSWCPRCYLIKDNALIFEDLGVQGFTMRDKLFDEELIKSGLIALASLHASSLIAEETMGKLFQEIFPEDLHDVAFVKTKRRRKWFLAGQDAVIRVAEEMSLDASRLPETFGGIFKSMESSKTKINVISHGDLWGNNLLFNGESPPECKLVDFQLFRYSPVGHDIAQFFYLCASRELRDSKKRELLKFYYHQLLKFVENVKRVPSLEEVLQGYEEQRIAACCTAALYFPTVLLDGVIGAEIMDNTETYAEYYFEDRREIVLKNMKRDAVYGERIRETVRELVEMSFKLDKFPEPS